MQGLANGVTEDMSAEQALQKKLDNIKNFINENINSIRNDIKQKQSGFADTLKSGTLFDTNTFVFGDTTQTGIKLHDFTKDTQANINWANLLTQLEERLYSVSDDSTLNSTFMQLVRDMGITDGTSFIDAAMKVNDEQFKEYIDGWQTYQKSAEIAAAQTYSREANQLQSDFLGEVANGLTNVVDNFKAGGADSANAFGNGFMEKIKGVMVQIQEQLQSYTNEFTLTGSALRGLGSSTTNNTSYDNRSTNVTINNSGGNPSAYEQRQQINRVFNQLQLQGVL